MTQPAKAQEPSMEEILASIRRIISDDEAKPAAGAAAAAPAAAPAAPRRPKFQKRNVPSGSGPARSVMTGIPPSKIAPTARMLHRLLRRLPQRTARPRSTP
jgi:cell pole-organizing protein PopZ